MNHVVYDEFHLHPKFLCFPNQVAVQPDAKMSTADEPQQQQGVPSVMEDQLRQLQLELKEKN